MDWFLWMGHEAALATYLKLLEMEQSAGAESKMFHGGREDGDDDDEPNAPPYEVIDGIALYRIQGPLTNRDSFLNRLFGVTSYMDIRNAMVHAAQNEAVNAIVLDIDSPGGTAAGISDVSELIQKVDRRIKPVLSFTSGSMTSAAYWLGSSGREIHAAEVSTVGSIGVIAVHFDLTKMLQQQGVKATVLRSGEYKAVGNPYETLTDERKAILQGQMDQMYGVFVDHVAQARGRSPAYVRSHMAEGRAFVGRQALDAGLVDDVSSLDTLVEKARKKFDNVNRTVPVGHGNGGIVPATEGSREGGVLLKEESMKKQKVLTSASVAAIAEGASVGAATQATTDAGSSDSSAQATQATQTTTDVGSSDSSAQAATDAGSSDSSAQAATQASASESAVVTYLRGEVTALTEKLVTLTAERNALDKDMAAMRATHAGMSKIVCDSINRMTIAMGGTSIDLSSLPAEALLQQYAQAQKKFHETFPVGGVARVEDNDAEGKAASAPEVHKARLRAVRS